MQVAKWGNSLAVRLPQKLVKELNLKEGDNIEITQEANTFLVSKTKSAEEVLCELREFRGKLKSSERLSRVDANAR